MRILAALIFSFFVCACSKKSDAPPKPPQSTQLAYPDKNSECNTGISISDDVSEVEFRWQSSADTEVYELQVTNLTSGTSQSINTPNTTARVPLDKGAPYTWKVLSKNSKTSGSASSETWAFYNAGFITAFAPFPAEIITPKIGDNAFVDINNEVTLEWSGSDLDNDIDSFQLYYGTENPPTTLLETTTSGITEYKVTAVADTVYFWKIITKDKEGNTSDSGVFSFKAL